MAFTQPAAEAAELPSKADIKTLVYDAANRHNLNADHFYKTLYYESEGFRDPALQSEVKDSKGPNGRENSWGYCQINLDWNPRITKAMASDPKFCIEWAAIEWEKGHVKKWHGYERMIERDWQL